jgi:asparagine synthase (glutamine-hydrolysing)
LNPRGRLNQLLRDSVRGSALAALPFYDQKNQKKVIALLDRVQLDAPAQSAFDNALTGILSACLLQQQLHLDA